MLEYGSIRSIRKTEDGRYCIAYCRSSSGQDNYQFLLAKYIHLSTGYPAIKLLTDLEQYHREHPEESGEQKTVVQGYESHDYIYQKLEKNGGTVVIRGSGIVASQIFERLYEAHKIQRNITVIHLNREPRKGNQFESAQRQVEHDWEFQPFNWPKGTWGGDMRAMLEAANPLLRRELLQAWGGTTTASRKKWRRIVEQGKSQNWYKICYGLVKKLERNNQGLELEITVLLMIMTPTLFGRWQTRIFLLATVGILVYLPFSWGYLGVKSDFVYFWIVFYVGLLGIAWDVLYDFLQKYFWDHDWPGIFQFYAGVVEGLVLALLIANIGLPNIPKTEFDLITFIKNYGLVWLAVYLSAWVMMRLLFPRWRFRGGEWMGKWPI